MSVELRLGVRRDTPPKIGTLKTQAKTKEARGAERTIASIEVNNFR
jgi:hypothetical protein